MTDGSPVELMVLGSLAQNDHDRHHDAADLCAVNVLRSGAFEPLDVVWPSALGASTGAEFSECVVLASQSTLHMPLAVLTGLSDVHELSVDTDGLWVPNTGANEVIQITHEGDISRHSIGSGYHHGNQVFTCVAGTRRVLVHHVHGRQLLRRVAGRLVKSQGDGGLLGIDAPNPVELHLSAPHSARVVGDENWILDSGRAQLTRFSSDWTVLGHIALAGWGRGAHLTDDGRTLYVGMSPLRRRYKSVSEVAGIDQPEVHVIDVETHRVVERLPVAGIDQINGLLAAPVDAVMTSLATTTPELSIDACSSIPLARSRHG